MSNKWYYKLCNDNEEETLYCAVNLPVKSEKLAEFLGFEKFNYTVTEISESEYIKNINCQYVNCMWLDEETGMCVNADSDYCADICPFLEESLNACPHCGDKKDKEVEE